MRRKINCPHYKEFKEFFKDKIEIACTYLKEKSPHFGDRFMDIFVNRIMSEKPVTLKALATKYGLQSERIRQNEAYIMRICRCKYYAKEKLLKWDRGRYYVDI